MTFNEKLVKLRKIKGLTQDEFASAVGVSRQAVYKWESGQSYPEVAKLLEIKMLFGISIDDLLDESYEVILPEKPKKKRAKPAPKAEKAPAEEAPAEEKAEEPAPVIEAAPAPAEEKVAEPVAAKPEEAKEDAAPVEEKPVESAAAEPAPAEVPAEPAAGEDEKKVGFFGRLFGRRK